MENSIYLGLSRQSVLQTNMDIIANNVANVNTPGFRAQNILFEEYVSKPNGHDDPLSFVLDRGQYQVTDPGPVKLTGNPLDVALQGPGFIRVTGPDGGPAYTRAGNMQVALDTTLVTTAGFAINDADGATILVPGDTTELIIDDKGVIKSQDGELGTIAVVEFENIQSLKPIGNNLYVSDETPRVAEETNVKQEHLEGSNVNAVLEMTRMIDTLRTYQSVQRVMQSESERLQGAIRRLTNQN